MRGRLWFIVSNSSWTDSIILVLASLNFLGVWLAKGGRALKRVFFFLSSSSVTEGSHERVLLGWKRESWRYLAQLVILAISLHLNSLKSCWNLNKSGSHTIDTKLNIWSPNLRAISLSSVVSVKMPQSCSDPLLSLWLSCAQELLDYLQKEKKQRLREREVGRLVKFPTSNFLSEFFWNFSPLFILSKVKP